MRRPDPRVVLVGLLGVVAFLGAWKLYVVHWDVSPFLLPPPEDVARATWDLVQQADTWRNARTTLIEIVCGFALATVAGIVLGSFLAELPLLDRALTPHLVAFQVVPKVILIPLLVLWFGFGSSTRVVIAAMFAFFPILTGTQAGIRAVDPGHHDLLATLRAKPLQRLRMVHLPSALPSILTGMEVGIVLATIGAILGEYLSASGGTGHEGLGLMAQRELSALRVDRMMGVVVLMSVLGWLVHAAVIRLRRMLVPWHPSAREAVRL